MLRMALQNLARIAGYSIIRRDTFNKLVRDSAVDRDCAQVSGGDLPSQNLASADQSNFGTPTDGSLLADDGREYRLILREGEPSVTVPKATVDTLLRESLLLRRKAVQLAEFQSLYDQRKNATEEQDILHQVGSTAAQPDEFYTPTYNYDGLRTDPRVIHNHNFMRDARFVAAYRRGLVAAGTEQHYYWRVHVALWCADHARHLDGDFVECGVWRGLLSSCIMEYLNWDIQNKQFYLFDTFRGIDETQLTDEEILKGNTAHFRHHYQNDIYEDVVANFSGFANVTICRGSVPESLLNVDIGKVAYLSIDMNNAAPEIAAANHFWDKLVPGAVILLDDYGFVSYETQKNAFDKWAADRGVPILALPTGQGLMMKPSKFTA